MPHAKRDPARTNGVHTEKTMGSNQITNGERPYSQFLNHLTSYPVVSDGISTYKSNPYGAKSLNIISEIYRIVDANLYRPISPYLQTPYSYAAPYVAKADSLGDKGLSNLESRFPIVKEDSNKLKEKTQGVVLYPVAVANEKKDAVLKIYGEEVNKYEKRGYGPLLKHARALVDTDLRVIIAVLQTSSEWVLQTQKTAKAKTHEKKEQLQKKQNNST